MQGDSLKSVENDTFKSDDAAREPRTPKSDLPVPDVCIIVLQISMQFRWCFREWYDSRGVDTLVAEYLCLGTLNYISCTFLCLYDVITTTIYLQDEVATLTLQDRTNTAGRSQKSAIVVMEGADDKDIPSPFPFPPHYPAAIETQELTGTTTSPLLHQDSQCDAAPQMLPNKKWLRECSIGNWNKVPLLKVASGSSCKL